jgi:hypothetical protein
LGEGGSLPMSTGSEDVSLRSKEQLNNAFTAVEAQEKIPLYDAAIEEFKKAIKKWYKTNEAAFNTAKAAYDEEVAEIYETAETVTDPETGIKSYVNIELPVFSYAPLPQITEGLSTDISATSYALADDLGLLGNDTLQEVIDGLREAKKLETGRLFQAVPLSNKVVAVNNVVLPTTHKSLEDLYSFVITTDTASANHYRFKVAINVGYSQASVSSTLYSSEIDSVIDTDTTFSSKAVGKCCW